jgi:hypothetical protein
MAHGSNVDDTSNPDFLVAAALYDVYPDDDIVLRPGAIGGLSDSFTVIHVGEVAKGVQYLAGLYGEHNLEDMPINPMNLETLVIGVQLIEGRLTVTEALLVEASTTTIGIANMLMVAEYGALITTDQQSANPDEPEWIVLLEEYAEPVTCHQAAEIEVDSNVYYCYFGKGMNDGVTEFFLLIVQVIDNEFFPVDPEDADLWNALIKAYLDQFGIETEDESDDDALEAEEDPEEDDTDIC